MDFELKEWDLLTELGGTILCFFITILHIVWVCMFFNAELLLDSNDYVVYVFLLFLLAVIPSVLCLVFQPRFQHLIVCEVSIAVVMMLMGSSNVASLLILLIEMSLEGLKILDTLHYFSFFSQPFISTQIGIFVVIMTSYLALIKVPARRKKSALNAAISEAMKNPSGIKNLQNLQNLIKRIKRKEYKNLPTTQIPNSNQEALPPVPALTPSNQEALPPVPALTPSTQEALPPVPALIPSNQDGNLNTNVHNTPSPIDKPSENVPAGTETTKEGIRSKLEEVVEEIFKSFNSSNQATNLNTDLKNPEVGIGNPIERKVPTGTEKREKLSSKWASLDTNLNSPNQHDTLNGNEEISSGIKPIIETNQETKEESLVFLKQMRKDAFTSSNQTPNENGVLDRKPKVTRKSLEDS